MTRNINIYVIENGFTVYDSISTKEFFCKNKKQVIKKIIELLSKT